MFSYLFPIFAFGLVITGIVFLGLQQASDLAKDLTARKREGEENGQSPEPGALDRYSPPVKAPASGSHR